MEERAINFVFDREGGKIDDPLDKGGRTNMGVTQRTYDKYRKLKGLPLADVWGMSKNEAEDVYDTFYWGPSGCNSLVTPLTVAVLDTAVNFGVFRAVQFLQRASGAKEDGVLGPNTIKAANSKPAKDLALKIVDFRLKRRDEIVAKDPSQKKYLNGWKNRDHLLEAEILK